MEGMLIGKGKADETVVGQKLEEPEEYDADEQIVGGVDLEKQQQSNRPENIGMCVYIECLKLKKWEREQGRENVFSVSTLEFF